MSYLTSLVDQIPLLKSINPYVLLGIFFALMSYLLFPLYQKKMKTTAIEKTPSSEDLYAIAGDDVIATQLDLARAYIELDKKTMALYILEEVIKSGNSAQVKLAKQLKQSI